jgi:hypothetical protein
METTPAQPFVDAGHADDAAVLGGDLDQIAVGQTTAAMRGVQVGRCRDRAG